MRPYHPHRRTVLGAFPKVRPPLVAPLLILVVLALHGGCKTTSGASGRRTSEGPGVVDGVRWSDPGPGKRVQAAYSTFHY
jgi:hypothetical protein